MKRKWLLAIGLTLVLATVGLCGCSQGSASPANLPNGLQVNLNTQQEGIWVTGKGEVTVVPDIAIVILDVEVQKATVAEAQAEATEAMNKVMAALKDSGIAEEDIQTKYFDIREVRERLEPYPYGERKVVGYEVTNMVSVKIRDKDLESRPFDYRVGITINAVAEAGGDLVRIHGIKFSVDDPSAYYEELREKAMIDAEAKAKQLAELAGVTVGKATYVSEGIQTPRWMDYDYMWGGMAPAPIEAPPPSISPGETKISLTIQAAYAIM